MKLFCIEFLKGNAWFPLPHPEYGDAMPIHAFATLDLAIEHMVMALICDKPPCPHRLRVVVYKSTNKQDWDYHNAGMIQWREFGDYSLTHQKNWAKERFAEERAKLEAEDQDEGKV